MIDDSPQSAAWPAADDDPADEGPSLPEHLSELPGGAWALWRWVGLRGTGFPAARVADLADPACADAAERLIQAGADAERERAELTAALEGALEQRRRALDAADEGQREPLLRELRAIKQWGIRNLKPGRAPQPLDEALPEAALVEGFRAAEARRAEALAAFQRAYADASARTSQVLRELAGDARFREALIWQNRAGFHHSVDALRRAPPGARGAKQRQREELVATYAQRYCVKNDTVGFFGPVGWARLDPWAQAIDAQPGRRLLAARTVYFDEWGIEALARKLAENQALLPWLAPRRMPFVHIEGTTLYLLAEAPLTLSAAHAAILHACDGTRTAKEIAHDLLQQPASGLRGEQEIYQILRYMRDQGLIAWSLEIPLELRPERTLQRLLERIGDEALRRPAFAALEELDAARAAVAQAAGDAERLDQALGELEATFTRLTGAAPTRAAGQMYASRTLVYEDCRRNIDVAIGPDVLEQLGPPLTLLLESARWLTYQVAAHYRQAFHAIYADLVRESGAPVVDLISFWRRVQTILEGERTRAVAALAETLQEGWAAILDLDERQPALCYASADLRARVQEAFAAPAPGWRSIPYHSPDIMVAAEGLEAIARGDYQLIMGELHVGMNTLGIACFLAQHPAQQELFLALELDQAAQRIVPVLPRSWRRMTSRTRTALVSPRDYRLVFDPDTPGVPRSRMVPIGSLLVEQRAGALVAFTRDGRLSFDLVEGFATLLAALTANSFQIVRPRAHTPRVTIDRLVVCRETWRCAPDAIPFAHAEDDGERFVAARRWARAQGMPRWVFVKLPDEEKPFYVDFDSPIYVNILARLVRRAAEQGADAAPVVIAEMLPRPDQLWLPDAEGQRYTSELRFVAVDRTAKQEEQERREPA